MTKLKPGKLIEVNSNPTSITPIGFPTNLTPYIFKCKKCGCIIRRVIETNSYILMTISKEIELGKIKICPFCHKLREYNQIGT